MRLKTDETFENMLLKHLQKTPEKILKNYCKHIQHQDKTLATYI
jgi:hypothetical protein